MEQECERRKNGQTTPDGTTTGQKTSTTSVEQTTDSTNNGKTSSKRKASKSQKCPGGVVYIINGHRKHGEMPELKWSDELG